jgi:hypothetical protein
MQYIILIGDETLTLESIKSIDHYGSIGSHDVPEIGARYCVDYGKDHIFYDYDDIIDDYEESDLKKIPFKNPHFITMIYGSESRMRKVLCQNNFLKEIYIDNGYDLVIPIEEFIELGMPVGFNIQNKLKRELELFLKYLNKSNDSLYGNVEKEKKSINDILKDIDNNKKIDTREVNFLIAPTGGLQEVSINSGWGKNFLVIAEKINNIIICME